jgi:hypothetical protein
MRIKIPMQKGVEERRKIGFSIEREGICKSTSLFQWYTLYLLNESSESVKTSPTLSTSSLFSCYIF